MPWDAFVFAVTHGYRSLRATVRAQHPVLVALLSDIPREATAIADFTFPHVSKLSVKL